MKNMKSIESLNQFELRVPSVEYGEIVIVVRRDDQVAGVVFEEAEPLKGSGMLMYARMPSDQFNEQLVAALRGE